MQPYPCIFLAAECAHSTEHLRTKRQNINNINNTNERVGNPNFNSVPNYPISSFLKNSNPSITILSTVYHTHQQPYPRQFPEPMRLASGAGACDPPLSTFQAACHNGHTRLDQTMSPWRTFYRFQLFHPPKIRHLAVKV